MRDKQKLMLCGILCIRVRSRSKSVRFHVVVVYGLVLSEEKWVAQFFPREKTDCRKNFSHARFV